MQVAERTAVDSDDVVKLGPWVFQGKCTTPNPPSGVEAYECDDCRLRVEVGTVHLCPERLWWSLAQSEQAQAKALCAVCPVRQLCRGFVDAKERGTSPALWFGVWGGETPDERRARRRQQARAYRP